MKVLRAACWWAAALLAVLLGIHVWKIASSVSAGRGDYVFAGIMMAMFIGAVWLALSISRELKNNPAPPR
jgi:FtsH-binding integral membrane protein